MVELLVFDQRLLSRFGQIARGRLEGVGGKMPIACIRRRGQRERCRFRPGVEKEAEVGLIAAENQAGEGALIGIGAIVLGGSRIGAGSLVAAGAVVRPGQRVPAGVLVAGVPGRVLRELTDEDRQTFADTAARYVQRAARHSTVTWTAPESGRR